MRTEPAPDTALVARMAQGERSALIELMARYHTTAYAVAYALLVNPEDTESVVSEAFDDLWQGAQRLDPDGNSVHDRLTSVIHLLAQRRIEARAR